MKNRLWSGKCWILTLMLSILLLQAGASHAAAKNTEVVLIATQHFIGDMPAGYTPGHLRALIKKVSPQVLAVEAPVNAENPWQYAPLECWQITIPLAEKLKIPVKRAGWNVPDYQTRLGQMFEAFTKKGVYGQCEENERTFQQKSAQQSLTCQFMNSPAEMSLWRDYHAGLHKLYGKDTPWEDWNKKIVDTILTICKQYQGRRVAVVFGAAHIYYMHDALARQKGVTLIPVEKFFPLTDKEIGASTFPADYIKALRLLNFDQGNVQEPQLKELEKKLAQAQKYPELKNDCTLYTGKLFLHRRQSDRAVAEFRKVAALPGSVLTVTDGKTSLREVGMVYVAIALIQKGDRAAARRELSAVLARKDISPATRQWAQSLLQGLGG